LIELPEMSSDTVFYEQVLTLIRQDDVYEASEFAAILARFDAAPHDLRRLRELFEYWLERQRRLATVLNRASRGTLAKRYGCGT